MMLPWRLPAHVPLIVLVVRLFDSPIGANAVAEAFQAAAEAGLERAWTAELDAGKPTNPVHRVVKLLKLMQAQLKKEADNEAEMYDEMVCWCKTTEEEKSKAIADANAKEATLESEIEERAARFGELATSIDALKKKLENDGETMAQAGEIREKEKEAFRQTENDMISAIESLKSAIKVLSKHHDASFLQGGNSELSSLRTVLRDVSIRYEMMQASKLSPVQSRLLPQVSLLSVRSARQRATEKAESALDKVLLAALDPRGEAISDSLPVQFAAQVLQHAAQKRRVGAVSQAAGFLQADEAAPYSSYNAQSGQVFGILQQMLEDFQANLSEQQGEEAKASKAFDEMGGAKADEVSAGKQKLDEMEMEHSRNEKALADAKEDLKLTRDTRSEDTEYLRNARLRCQNLDHEWELRSKTRSEEMTAVADAIAILTEDDNADILRRSPRMALIQESSEVEASASRKQKAAALLRQAAESASLDQDDLLSDWQNRNGRLNAVKSPQTKLSTLAVAVQLDSFTKVKEMMDKMISDLETQQADEVKHKAFCVKELDENEKATYKKTSEKEDLKDDIQRVKTAIKKLRKDIKAAKTEIDETNVAVKKASQTREKENAEYQSVLTDQRASQQILKKTLLRLKKFYKEKKAGKWVQLDAADGQQHLVSGPPLEFTNYTASKGASPVMHLIQQIIEDSEKVEKEAIEGEKSAQADYETFVKGSNDLVSELSLAVMEKGKAISSSEKTLAQAKGDHAHAIEELELLASDAEDLHGQCDFFVKNFEIRQTARAQEIEAIHSAKGILSGAK